MGADWFSAWSTFGALVVALIALVTATRLSLRAARSAEKSAESSRRAAAASEASVAVAQQSIEIAREQAEQGRAQAEIALRAYRFAAQPRITLSLDGVHIEATHRFVLNYFLTRADGPVNLQCNQYISIGMYFTAAGTTGRETREAPDSWGAWNHDGVLHGQMQIEIPPNDSMASFIGSLVVQMRESADSEVWTETIPIWWVREDDQ